MHPLIAEGTRLGSLSWEGHYHTFNIGDTPYTSSQRNTTSERQREGGESGKLTYLDPVASTSSITTLHSFLNLCRVSIGVKACPVHSGQYTTGGLFSPSVMTK